MPQCPACGRSVLQTDRFCLNCGRNLSSVEQSPPGLAVPKHEGKPLKNPVYAALLNFFFPGLGYVYNGLGRDIQQVVFGALVFLSVFVGVYVGFVVDAATVTTTGETTVSPLAALILLLFLLPWALAYDGYERAKATSK